jgi:hypothetical protein
MSGLYDTLWEVSQLTILMVRSIITMVQLQIIEARRQWADKYNVDRALLCVDSF